MTKGRLARWEHSIPGSGERREGELLGAPGGIFAKLMLCQGQFDRFFKKMPSWLSDPPRA